MTFLTQKRSKNGGFTLIELLVVIAIIGVLASIVLASLNTARKKSRDTRRVADMNQGKLALELFYDSNRRYPSTAAAEGTALLVPTFIASWPTDPITGTGYTYYAGLNNRADNGSTDNVCSTAAATCQLFHTGATVEDLTITAMASRAGGCPEATGSLPAGCSSSLDETTIHGRNTGFTCLNVAATGQGCYDVIP
ncbi:MAG: prepilin-type N-terminal cleavage/methylation domain-containing protein [Candidatus Sungbacteria bacterium]|nr:prepilin-type N-terminal cleavage/methylation domain-containing protein [Candidatus Sungbacteria bacterium]